MLELNEDMSMNCKKTLIEVMFSLRAMSLCLRCVVCFH